MMRPVGAALAVCLGVVWMTVVASEIPHLKILVPGIKPPRNSCDSKPCFPPFVCRLVMKTGGSVKARCLRENKIPRNGRDPTRCGPAGHPLLKSKEVRSINKAGKVVVKYELEVFRTRFVCPAPDLVLINGFCCVDVPVCLQPKFTGPCLAYFPRYYFNTDENECSSFIYGGCGANQNNFQTLVECQETCQDKCQLPKDSGPCYANFKRYYFDHEENECREFIYGGCLGNANNFLTLAECQVGCLDTCELPADPGPCKAYFPRYYYDPDQHKCVRFIYGGCLGNANNFQSFSECQVACAPPAHVCPFAVPPMHDGTCGDGERCEDDKDCDNGRRCCKTKCGYKTCSIINFPTCATISCVVGNVCLETPKGGQCVKGCETPMGTFLEPGENHTVATTFCACKEDSETGGGVLDCKCVLPNGDFLLPGESNGDPCGPCFCDGESVLLACALILCASPQCDNPVLPEDQCCPICACTTPFGTSLVPGQNVTKDRTFCACEANVETGESEVDCQCVLEDGGLLAPGDTKKLEPCSTVTCNATLLIPFFSLSACAITECLDGTVLVRPPWDCCPTCDVCRSPSGTTISPGEEIREGGTVCTCRLNNETKDYYTDCKCVLSNGDLLSPGERNSDPCLRCLCIEKTVTPICAAVGCAPTLCDNPVVPKGACCPICNACPTPFGRFLAPGTEFREEETQCACKPINNIESEADCRCVLPNGNLLPPGETSGNPCQFCTCDNETVTLRCLAVACAQPDCEEPIVPEGACCPVCNGCSTPFGKFLAPGQEFREEDTLCACKANNETGESDADCRCVLANGKLLEPGETDNDSPCIFCTCDEKSVTLTCAIIDCARPPCSNPVTPPGACCPVCDVCRTPSGTEIPQGEDIKEGNTICSCKPNGDLGGFETVCHCVLPNGNLLSLGESNTDPCMPCFCDEITGHLICAIVDCFLPIPCNNPGIPKGQCCAVCNACSTPAGTFVAPGQNLTEGSTFCACEANEETGESEVDCQCVLPNGDMLAPGERKQTDPCTNCICDVDEVALLCATFGCALPLCPMGTVVTPPGACCPVCADCRTPKGTKILPGEEIREDQRLCTCEPNTEKGGFETICQCVLPNGDLLLPGQSNSNPCMPCICDEELVTPFCAIVDCFFQPPCDNPVAPKDVCCPICNACQTPFGNSIAPGRNATEGNTFCACEEVSETESELNCQCVLPNGDLLPPGQEDDDPCISCSCSDTVTLFCSAVGCPLRFPPCQDFIDVEGVCCPVCNECQAPSGLPLPLGQTVTVEEDGEDEKNCTCVVDSETGLAILGCQCEYPPGEVLPHGQSRTIKCTTCFCDNSTLACNSIRCAAPDCENYFVPEGGCCPLCPEPQCQTPSGQPLPLGRTVTIEEGGNEKNCTCVLDPFVNLAVLGCQCEYPPGEVLPHGQSRTLKCSTCFCDNSTLACNSILCAAPDCENYFVPEDGCCPVCPQPPKPGSCPLFPSPPRPIPPGLGGGIPPICPGGCQRDEDCPGDKKCCGTGVPSSCRLCTTPIITASCAAVTCFIGTTCVIIEGRPRCVPLIPDKPGQCPIPTGAGPCVELCAGDGSCPGKEKCCSNGCGHVCTKPISSCSDLPCLIGTTCEIIDGIARCVPLVPDKPGQCPIPTGFGICVDLCAGDGSCPGKEKCCSNGCGHVCKNPVSSCTNVSCLIGATCSVIDGIAQCVPFIPDKPGQCPIPTGFGICVELCAGDGSCPGKEKCCSNGCGHVCKNPVSSCTNVSCLIGATCAVIDGIALCVPFIPDKPGQCPIPTGAGPCVELCAGDGSCPGKEKCCSNGCGHVCKNPISPCSNVLCPKETICIVADGKVQCVPLEKPGECPNKERFGLCGFACETDYDCDDDQKCCQTTCPGTTCVDPLPPKLTCANAFCPKGTRCIQSKRGPKCVPERPGMCPLCFVIFSGKKECEDECKQDYDCPKFHKCCDNCKGCNTCHKMSFENLCDKARCSKSQECVLQEVACITDPCLPLPRCIRKKSKEGQCPSPRLYTIDGPCTDDCRADKHCKGPDKCCPTSCKGSICNPPIPDSSCNGVKCTHRRRCREVYDLLQVMPQCLDNCAKTKGKCPRGKPLYEYRGGEPTLAFCGRGPNRMDCPAGYFCNISPTDRYAVCCRKKKPDCYPACGLGQTCDEKHAKCVDVCSLPAEVGPCRASIERYYYDMKTQRCLTFTYGGCKGNENNFITLLECQTSCYRHACTLPEDPGPCEGLFPRFYYDSKANLCRPFIYGGCEGNANNFETFQDCLYTCGAEKRGRCPVVEGPGFCVVSSLCQEDKDCPGGQKCCKTCCRGSVCVNPIPSCRDKRCLPGTKCIETETDAICVPIKPGQCPQLKCPVPFPPTCEGCQHDGQCPGSSKCCFACGGCDTCIDVTIPDPCKGVICAKGEKCIPFEVQCVTTPCFPQARCVPKDDKPGVCPPIKPGSVGTCAFQCSRDDDCKQKDKCCKTACGGTTCSPPIIPPTCDHVKCTSGRKCREVYDTKLVSVQCLENPPETPRDDECVLGLPLLVLTQKGFAVANCGDGPDTVRCPLGWTCQQEPVKFLLCCRTHG